ncbi:MAG: DUF3450 family protein [Deltaproteobacteria bacterium]|nr:DUF3450 family protein [Deltaproteobacteria bacterium]MBW2068703.1 DUF3450 family protein [Deltaproteobacteria bacterium]
MKSRKVLVFMLVSMWVNAGVVRAVTGWSDVEKGLKREIAESQKVTEQINQRIESEKESLQKELKDLQKQAEKLEAEVNSLKKSFDGVHEQEKALGQKVSAARKTAMDIQKDLLSMDDELEELFKRNPTVLSHGDLSDLRAKLRDPDYVCTFGDFRSVIEVLLQEIEEGGRVRKQMMPVYVEDGSRKKLEILRVGTSALFAIHDNDVHLVKLAPDLSLVISRVPLPHEVKQLVKKYSTGTGNLVPIDLSWQAAYENVESFSITSKVIRWFLNGGTVMWPLLVVAIASVAIIAERLWFFRKQKMLDDKTWQDFLGNLERRRLDTCKKICSLNLMNPALRVISMAMEKLDHISSNFQDRTAVEDAVYEAFFEESNRLERFLSTIAMFAAVSPLLGLLGTVSGIIQTFQTITVVGTGNPKYLSAGISEALITTQFGLMIAVPLVVAHHFFERYAERFTEEAEEKAMRVCEVLVGKKEAER